MSSREIAKMEKSLYHRLMSTKQALFLVESGIKKPKEHEYFLIHEERYKAILNHIHTLNFPHKDKPRILDVGCYPYHLGAALERLGFDVYGISSAHEPIHSSKIKICNIENDKFPFKDNFFDIIICTEVVEHLPQSPTHALREMHRVTNKNGSLLVTTPNIARSINRVKLLFGRSVTYPLSQVLENDGNGSVIYHRHNREYTLAELAELVRAGNWHTATAKHVISYVPWRRRVRTNNIAMQIAKWLNYAVMAVFPTLRDTLLIIGNKPV